MVHADQFLVSMDPAPEVSVHVGGNSYLLTNLRKDALVGALRFEDVLDAIVCAWVAVCTLEGQEQPLGDEVSAIWIPTSRFA
jgi:hypothetical protein